MARGVRLFRRYLAQCAVVQGRVIAAPVVRRANRQGYYDELNLTVEYTYAGRLLQVRTSVAPPLGALIGWTPELLVDTQDPARVLFREHHHEDGGPASVLITFLEGRSNEPPQRTW